MTDSSLPNHPQPKDSFSELAEQLFLDRIIVIGDNEFSLKGCPAELMQALTQIHNDLLVEARKDIAIKVLNTGFNEDCLFCGLKDRACKAQTKGENDE